MEALVAERDARPAARRLGRSRSQLGVGGEETMDDVVVLWHVHARREPPAGVLQALVGGWAEAGLEPAGAASCFDTITGLTTRAHLEARLAELYRSGELGGPQPAYRLVVVDVGVAGGQHPAAHVAWRQVEELCRAAEAARRVFLGGETLTRLAPMRIGALAPSGPVLSRRLAALEDLLQAGAEPDVVPAVWVEALPRTFSLVSQLLADLAR